VQPIRTGSELLSGKNMPSIKFRGIGNFGGKSPALIKQTRKSPVKYNAVGKGNIKINTINNVNILKNLQRNIVSVTTRKKKRGKK
jgi:hypothetical protein